MPIDEGHKVLSEGDAWENVVSHVIGLIFGDSANKVFLLDTRLGIIHWPESDGGGDHRRNYNDDPWFIDMAYDAEDHVPENEVAWRNAAPAWAIVGFFELLKMQYRKLNWIPVMPDNL